MQRLAMDALQLFFIGLRRWLDLFGLYTAHLQRLPTIHSETMRERQFFNDMHLHDMIARAISRSLSQIFLQ